MRGCEKKIGILFSSLLKNVAFPFTPQSGKPFITSITNKQYLANSQNWAIMQDDKGIIYIGNNGGLLIREGFDWTFLNVENKRIISFCKNIHGVIYTGLDGNFGYVTNSNGKLNFVSLLNALPENYRNFNSVWSCFSLNGNEYFCTPEYIFIFKNNKFIQAVDAGISGTFHKFFIVNKTLYLRQNGVGLQLLNKKNKLERVNGGAFFSAIKIDLIQATSKGLLIGTRDKGLFLLDSLHAKHLNCEASSFFETNYLYCFESLGEDKIACGTQLGGIIIINTDGKILDAFDKKSGLNDNNVHSLFMDIQGLLWAALDNGLTYIELSSPYRFYKSTSASQDNVNSIFADSNFVYAATTTALFAAKRIGAEINEFTEVESSPLTFYNNLSAVTIGQKKQIWVLSQNGIFSLENNHLSVIDKEASGIKLLQLNGKQNIVIVRGYGVIYVYQFIQNQWKKTKEFEMENNGISPGIFSSMVEDKAGKLWIGEKDAGVFSVNSDELLSGVEPKFTKYHFIKNLESSSFTVFDYADKIYCCTDEGIYVWDSAKDIFTKGSFINPEFNKNRRFFGIFKGSNNNRWFATESKSGNENTQQLVFVKNSNNSLSIIQSPFARLFDIQVNSVYHFSDQEIWLGTNEGIIKTKISAPFATSNYTIIKEVKIKNNVIDSIIYKGLTHNDKNKSLLLEYKLNSLEFTFYSTKLTAASETQFSTWLEGFEENYSAFSHESNKRNFTNLYEGEYTFHVISKDIYGQEGQEAIFRFTVKPPFYRTWWAYCAYLLVFSSIVYLVSKVYNRVLIKQKQKLAQQVKTQTIQLEQANKILAEKNEETTQSINYAKYIQSTMLPEIRSIQSFAPNSFVYFKPRNIVSGDFYWFCDLAKHFPGNENFQFKAILVLADCTGHGVPGAFMSMIGIEKLNLSVNAVKNITAANILSFVNIELKNSLKQHGSDADSKDGMEMALCIIDKRNRTIEFAGANRPLVIFNSLNENFQEIKLTKAGLASTSSPHQIYESTVIELKNGDRCYLFSDGIVDQFGGERKRKLGSKGFHNLIRERKELSLDSQLNFFEKFYTDWMKDEEQVDDISLIGFEI